MVMTHRRMHDQMYAIIYVVLTCIWTYKALSLLSTSSLVQLKSKYTVHTSAYVLQSDWYNFKTDTVI